LPSGNAVCEFGLAINRSCPTQSGDQREEVTYFELSCFDQGGEVIQQYCNKGSPLFVEGRLRFDSWQNEKGENRNRLSVIVEDFQLLPSGRGEKVTILVIRKRRHQRVPAYQSKNLFKYSNGVRSLYL